MGRRRAPLFQVQAINKPMILNFEITSHNVSMIFDVINLVDFLTRCFTIIELHLLSLSFEDSTGIHQSIRSHPNPSLILISILSKSYTTYLCQAMSTSCILIRIPNSIYLVPPITPHNHHGRANQGKGLAYLPLYFLHFFPFDLYVFLISC